LLFALQRNEVSGREQVADASDAADELDRARRRITRVEAGAGLASLRSVHCDPALLRIVSALEGTRLSVGDLAAVIGRQVPATSQHLRILRELGLVSARRSRSQVYYRLRPGAATTQVRAILSAVRRPLSPTA
jgi:ArsR family transcriptional regulator